MKVIIIIITVITIIKRGICALANKVLGVECIHYHWWVSIANTPESGLDLYWKCFQLVCICCDTCLPPLVGCRLGRMQIILQSDVVTYFNLIHFSLGHPLYGEQLLPSCHLNTLQEHEIGSSWIREWDCSGRCQRYVWLTVAKQTYTMDQLLCTYPYGADASTFQLLDVRNILQWKGNYTGWAPK